MLLSSRTFLIATAPLLLVGIACSEPGRTFSIEATVTLCPVEGQCSSLAASRAEFEITTGGNVIKRGVLGLDGTFEMTIEDTGTFSARVELEGLEPVENSMTISEGDSGSLSLALSANVEEPR